MNRRKHTRYLSPTLSYTPSNGSLLLNDWKSYPSNISVKSKPAYSQRTWDRYKVYSSNITGYSDRHKDYSSNITGYSDCHKYYSSNIIGYSDRHKYYSSNIIGYSDRHKDYSSNIIGYPDHHKDYSSNTTGYPDRHKDYSSNIIGYPDRHKDYSSNTTGHADRYNDYSSNNTGYVDSLVSNSYRDINDVVGEKYHRIKHDLELLELELRIAKSDLYSGAATGYDSTGSPSYRDSTRPDYLRESEFGKSTRNRTFGASANEDALTETMLNDESTSKSLLSLERNTADNSAPRTETKFMNSNARNWTNANDIVDRTKSSQSWSKTDYLSGNREFSTPKSDLTARTNYLTDSKSTDRVKSPNSVRDSTQRDYGKESELGKTTTGSDDHTFKTSSRKDTLTETKSTKRFLNLENDDKRRDKYDYNDYKSDDKPHTSPSAEENNKHHTYSGNEYRNEETAVQLRRKDETINDLTKRLSAEMSAKLAQAETNLENVSIKSRPVNIVTEYETICSVEWHNAKCLLDEKCGKTMDEEDRVKVLKTVLIEAERNAKDIFSSFWKKIDKVVSQPIDAVTSIESKEHTEMSFDSELQSKLSVPIGDSLRVGSERTDVSGLSKIILDKIYCNDQFQGITEINESPIFKEYVNACAKLAWKMVIQRPSMEFKENGIDGNFVDKEQEVHWGSSDPSDKFSLVKYYVHPSLYHGDILMKKGRVYLAKY